MQNSFLLKFNKIFFGLVSSSSHTSRHLMRGGGTSTQRPPSSGPRSFQGVPQSVAPYPFRWYPNLCAHLPFSSQNRGTSPALHTNRTVMRPLISTKTFIDKIIFLSLHLHFLLPTACVVRRECNVISRISDSVLGGVLFHDALGSYPVIPLPHTHTHTHTR